MKKIIILLVFFAFTKVGNAQILTLNDLIEKSKCTSLGCFDDFVTKKGFAFSESKDTLQVAYYTFLSTKTFQISNGREFTNSAVVFFNKRSGVVSTGFRTSVIAQYTALLEQIKKAGFAVSDSKVLSTGTVSAYLSSKYPKIKVLSGENNQVSENGAFVSYSITVIRNP